MNRIIDYRSTFKRLFNETLEILKNLTTDEFYSKTSLPTWRVNDIISHLSSNALLKSSEVEKQIKEENRQFTNITFDELAKIIEKNNEKRIAFFSKLEQNTLIDFYAFCYNTLLNKFDSIMDLSTTAVHQVKWIHDTESPWWMDIAREYTELWIHLTQILLAINNTTSFKDEYFQSFTNICLLALDKTYKRISYNFSLEINIDTLIWLFHKKNNEIEQYTDRNQIFDTHISITLSKNAAYSIFSGSPLSEEQKRTIVTKGNKELIDMFLSIKCFMIPNK